VRAIGIPLPVWSRLRVDGLELAVLVAAERGGPAGVSSLIARATQRSLFVTLGSPGPLA